MTDDAPTSDDLPILVDAAWVRENPSAVRADVRWYLDGRSGRAAFEQAHLPGAVFVDLDVVLADHTGQTAPSDGRHPLPSAAAFAESMGALGIGDDDTVVAYDDSGGGTAGRLVWMLRASGHRACLLDGGLKGWNAAVDTGPGSARQSRSFTAHAWPANQLATVEEVAANRERHVTLLDARSGDRYRGENEVVDRRSGHIPGARSAPWSTALDPATGRFRSPEELRRHFAALGVTAGQDVVVYCGSGVSACANLVALEHAGLGGAKLFVASWSGWSSDPDRPIAAGDE